MTGNGTNQEGQQLHNQMEALFWRLLKTDVQRIEYKPQFAVQLLEMPAEYREEISRQVK